MRRLLLLFFMLVSLSALLTPNANAFPTCYDKAFRQWGQYYFPWDDWNHWKAQSLAESGLNPSAKSWCGAIGLMELMPTTAKDLKVNPYDPESNIQGGIKYDRRLWKLWGKAPTADERRNLTFASYNAGGGNIQKAQRLAGKFTWESISLKLPAITGRNAKETQGYILHINTFYKQLIGF